MPSRLLMKCVCGAQLPVDGPNAEGHAPTGNLFPMFRSRTLPAPALRVLRHARRALTNRRRTRFVAFAAFRVPPMPLKTGFEGLSGPFSLGGFPEHGGDSADPDASGPHDAPLLGLSRLVARVPPLHPGHQGPFFGTRSATAPVPCRAGTAA